MELQEMEKELRSLFQKNLQELFGAFRSLNVDNWRICHANIDFVHLKRNNNIGQELFFKDLNNCDYYSEVHLQYLFGTSTNPYFIKEASFILQNECFKKALYEFFQSYKDIFKSDLVEAIYIKSKNNN